MMQQMIITNPTINKSLGRWEYDIKNDTIILNNGAAQIYYNESDEKRVFIDEFFRILSVKSCQWMSNILTSQKESDAMFFQQVCCNNGQTKRVLVIVFNNNDMTKNKQGLSVDVTKIL